MNDFYVYAHYTADTEELFYIGKGKGRRFLSKDGRNKYWNSIVKKHDFRSEIIVGSLEESIAFEKEIELIELHKPKANLTKGGIGGYTGLNNGIFKKGTKPWNTGKKCNFISERQSGSKNHMYGKPSARRRQIRCIDDNKIFDSVEEAYKYYKISKSGMFKALSSPKSSIKNLRFEYV